MCGRHGMEVQAEAKGETDLMLRNPLFLVTSLVHCNEKLLFFGPLRRQGFVSELVLALRRKEGRKGGRKEGRAAGRT